MWLLIAHLLYHARGDGGEGGEGAPPVELHVVNGGQG